MLRLVSALCVSAILVTAHPVADDRLCQVCSEAVKDVKNAIDSEKIHAAMVGKLEAVCSMVPPDRFDLCAEVMGSLTQDVLAKLPALTNPVQICVAMTVCQAPTNEVSDREEPHNSMPEIQAEPPVQRVGVDNFTCELCEYLVQIVDALTKNKTTPAQANATAYRVCELFPQPARDTCVTFIPLIIDMIINGVDPVGACTNIGVCLDEKPVNNLLSVEAIKPENPSVEGPACSLCELLVQAIDTYLQKNRSEAAINATVYKLCNDLPGNLKDMCLAFAPQLVAVLAKGVDPAKACTTIHLCASTEPEIMVPSYMEKAEGPACSLCELLVQAIDTYLQKNRSEAAINATVYKLCNDLPGNLKDMCLAFAPQLVAVLAKGVDPAKACTTIHLCASTEPEIMVPSYMEKAEGPACSLCELLVQAIDTYLQKNRSEAAINATVYKLCNDLPGNLKDMCLAFAPQLVAVLAKGVDPAKACTTIHLCASTEPEIMVPSYMEKAEGPACSLCELLVQAIDTYLQKNRSEAAINATVYKLCNDLPGNLKDMCLAFAPQLVAVLAKGVDPAKACTTIHLCTSTESEVMLPSYTDKVEGPACSLCELLVQAIDTYLQKNRSEAAINATVYKLCNDLPGNLKDMCLAFAPQLVAVLAKGVDPAKACTTIHLCASTESDVMVPSYTGKVEGPACSLCELLVQAIDTYLQKNRSEAAINATVYKLCNDLPGNLKDMCLAFAPQLVAVLAKGVDPAKACTTIHLCTSTVITRAEQQIPDIEENLEGPACTLCELLVQAIDSYIQNNRSEAAINATVYKLCNDLPGNLKDMCLAFAPQLVAVLAKGVDPAKACTTIHLCTSIAKASELEVENIEGPACTLCELLVQTIDTYLKNNRSEAAINATVYKLCNDLPGTLKITCLAFAPQLVAVLAKGVDPQKACTEIHLCTSSVRNLPQTWDKLTLTASSGPACSLCELLVQAIDTYLQKNRSEAAINATVYKLCNDLPGTLKITCLAFAPQLVAVLAKGVDPAKACTTIHLCTSTDFPVPVPREVEDSAACELCELLVQTVDAYLQNNRSEAAINATVYKLCNDLPGTLKLTCLAFAPQLVSVLAKGLDPEKACTAIKICTGTAEAARLVPETVPNTHVESGPACDLCELLVQAIDTYLQKNRSEAAINATVYKLCNDLPQPIKDTCLAFAPQLVAVLAKGVDPAKACTTIHLCASSGEGQGQGPLSNLLLNRRVAFSVGEGMWCTICKDHIEILDRDLYKDEGQVQTFLENICHRLPPPTDQACLNFADNNFPTIYDQILNGTASPDHICKLLKACP